MAQEGAAARSCRCQVEVRLVERGLRRVCRKGLLKSVALERAPVFGVERLAFPDTRVNQMDAGQIRPRQDDAVGVPAQVAIGGGESERLARGELEPGSRQLLAHPRFVMVPAGEDLARPGGKHRTAPPIILHPTQAFGPDDARAEVGARQFGRRLRGALERSVDRGIDRLDRQAGAIEIEHEKAPLKGRSRR